MFRTVFLCLSYLVCGTAFSMDLEAGNLKTIKWLLANAKAGLSPRHTNAGQCRYMGYNGTLITIVQYPEIFRCGYIIAHAQPSKWWGYSYDDSSEPANLIVMEDKLIGSIKHSDDIVPKIYASCLMHSEVPWANLAILWEATAQLKQHETHGKCWVRPREKKLYISLASLHEIHKQNNVFDLDADKVEVTLDFVDHK